eukprot:357528-Chlamydomonas_euryale.AAC.8
MASRGAGDGDQLTSSWWLKTALAAPRAWVSQGRAKVEQVQRPWLWRAAIVLGALVATGLLAVFIWAVVLAAQSRGVYA